MEKNFEVLYYPKGNQLGKEMTKWFKEYFPDQPNIRTIAHSYSSSMKNDISSKNILTKEFVSKVGSHV